MKHLLSTLAACLLSLCAMAEVSDYKKWMAGLDDKAFVCQVSIPGAHDACSSNFSGLLASIYKGTSQTQSLEVPAMLDLGLRLFDLRPCVSGSKLHINHGIASTKYDFDPVMQQLCDYLDANPSEFCVVVIRHESEGDSNSSKFGDMLQTSLAKVKDHLVDFRPNLTVGEARGKILFISRDEYTAPIYGGRTVDLADNRSSINDMLGGHCYGPETNRCAWWLQDHYEIPDANVKKQAIKDMLTRSAALAGKYDYTWVVNQTSGYTGTSSSAAKYQDNAVTSNAYMIELLQSGDYQGPTGLVFMDYAGVDTYNKKNTMGLSLTKAIVNHNFTYTMSRQDDPILQSGNLFVAPKGRDMMWEARFYRKEGPSQPGGEDGSAAAQLDKVTAPAADWYAVDFDDSKWETKRFPTASAGTGAPYYSQWDGTYNTLWIRREFTIDHNPAIDTYTFYVYHDDDYKVYINGSLLDTQDGWSTDFNNYRTVRISSAGLKVGRNVLAIQVQQNWGGAYFDCGVLRTEGTRAPLKLTGTGWHTFVAPGHAVDFSGTAVRAYKVVEVVEGGTPYAKAEEVTVVPADEAVIVRSDNGAGTYNIPVTKSEAAPLADNLLKAALSDLSVTQPQSIYCVAEKNGVSAFYPVQEGTVLPAGKGYLDLRGSNVKVSRLMLCDDDQTDGINGLTPDPSPERGEVYNLAGQRLQRPQKGLNIIGGRKVLR